MTHKTKTRSKRQRLAELLRASTRRRNVLSGLAVAVLVGGAGGGGLVAQQPPSAGPTLLNAASAEKLTTPTTSFLIDPFNKAIRDALERTTQLPAMQLPATHAARSFDQAETQSVTPVTNFDQALFDKSISRSLSELQQLRGAASPPSGARLQAPRSVEQSPMDAAPLDSTRPAIANTPIRGHFAATELAPNPLVTGDKAMSTVAESNPQFAGQLDVMSMGQSTGAHNELATPGSRMVGAGGFSTATTPSTPGNTAHCNAPGYFPGDFSPTPIDAASTYHDGQREAFVYDAKHDVPTQRPLIEWPRKWYTNGITPNGINMFGEKNLVRPKFYMYGDYRTAIIGGRNAAGRTDNWAHRLNLDLDLQITDTERFHMFMGPLDKNNRFTRLELIDGDVEFQDEIDFTPVTGFFEGDLGVILGATQGKSSPFELPFTAGLVPLLFQNGIWMEDAVTGAAIALPARHSRLLNISNMDTTFFAAVDQVNSPAFDGANAAQVFGTATFIEAYGGYIEAGYAYLNDRNNDDRDYHNATISFTRRYLDRISNSVRVIVNAGQDGPKDARTADGALLLVENSWISAKPLTVVPYANFFVGWDRPQSVARAAASGGILRNTGINFDTDGLNGFATLDTSGSDSAGGAIGVDLIGDSLDKQLVIEAAYQTPHGTANPNLPDDQFAIGSRLQFNLTHATLLRFDVMHGWRRGLEDVYGTRMEYRWKF